MVSEYKALREKEEDERRLEEMEKQKVEAEEKRIVSAELTARYRDRVLFLFIQTYNVKFCSYFRKKGQLYTVWYI